MSMLSRLSTALMFAVMFAIPATAQQVNPTAQAVQEEALMQALQGQPLAGRISIPDDRAAALIKPGNKDWAGLRQGSMWSISIYSALGMLAAVLAFAVLRGPMRVEGRLSGRKLLRFASIERFTHWLTASTFVVLSLSGLNLVIGRQLLQPLIGEAAFGDLTAAGKLAHNFLAWPFMVGIALMLVLWLWENLPAKVDLEWLAKGGGMFSRETHAPAGKFNAGQKIVFWVTVVGGAAMSFTGVMLLFPASAGGPADWQFYHFLHGIIAAGMTAMIIGHIYLGSVGVPGSFAAITTGEVNETWARQHHPLWAEEVAASGGRPSGKAGHGRPMPAE